MAERNIRSKDLMKELDRSGTVVNGRGDNTIHTFIHSMSSSDAQMHDDTME